MNCGKCGGKTKVLQTRKEGDLVVRERGCCKCGHRFRTTEREAQRQWVNVR